MRTDLLQYAERFARQTTENAASFIEAADSNDARGADPNMLYEAHDYVTVGDAEYLEVVAASARQRYTYVRVIKDTRRLRFFIYVL